MNVRKNIDYGALFERVDAVLAAELPQMEAYCATGRLIAERPEKGAAVAVAEYMQRTYRDASGFSPRNVRRMREFYCTYEVDSDIMSAAMETGWTQNVVILEADLTLAEKSWYICAVARFGWSKLELMQQIEQQAHLNVIVDTEQPTCYTEMEENDRKISYDKDIVCVLGQYLPKPNGRVYSERYGEARETGEPVSNRVRGDQRHQQWTARVPGSRQKLMEHGIDCTGKYAWQLSANDYTEFDLLIAMDQANLRGMQRICGDDPEGKIHLLMEYMDRAGEIADPWYTDDFDTAWQDIEEGCRGLLRKFYDPANFNVG